MCECMRTSGPDWRSTSLAFTPEQLLQLQLSLSFILVLYIVLYYVCLVKQRRLQLSDTCCNSYVVPNLNPIMPTCLNGLKWKSFVSSRQMFCWARLWQSKSDRLLQFRCCTNRAADSTILIRKKSDFRQCFRRVLGRPAKLKALFFQRGDSATCINYKGTTPWGAPKNSNCTKPFVLSNQWGAYRYILVLAIT